MLSLHPFWSTQPCFDPKCIQQSTNLCQISIVLVANDQDFDFNCTTTNKRSNVRMWKVGPQGMKIKRKSIQHPITYPMWEYCEVSFQRVEGKK